MTPREEGVQGQSPAIRRALRVRRLACPLGKQPPLRGVADAHTAVQGGKGGPGVLPRPTPPQPSARLGGTQRRGCATQATRPGAWCPARVAQAEGCNRPTIIRGPVATEHLRSDRHGPTGFARLAKSHRRSRRKALQRLPGCATAGARPAAAFGGGLERGRRLAPTRAPPLWSERSERNRRGAQPRGWEGVGPQAVGCGLLLGSRGHPIPFAVTAQQAPCGRCIGRPAGAKRKRASPCGLALFEVLTLSRRTPSVASIYYHNLPLLSRAAVRFFGC